jgi:hypothetical protein
MKRNIPMIRRATLLLPFGIRLLACALLLDSLVLGGVRLANISIVFLSIQLVLLVSLF